MISEASNQKGTDGFILFGCAWCAPAADLLSPVIKGGNLNERNLQDAISPEKQGKKANDSLALITLLVEN